MSYAMRLKMYLEICFLIYSCVIITAGSYKINRELIQSRKGMDSMAQMNPTKHLKSDADDTPRINLETLPREKKSMKQMETQKSKYEVNAKQSDKQIGTAPNSPVRRMDPTYQLQSRTTTSTRPAVTNPEIKIRQGRMETTTQMRTTSEDLLRWLLKQRLSTNHPAPEQIGMMPLGLMHPVTGKIWTFEDYDNSKSVSRDVKNELNTCEGQKMECLMDTDSSIPVCVADLTIPESEPWYGFQRGFPNECEVQYRNCLKIFEATGSIIPNDYNDNYLEFRHYGWCYTCGYLPHEGRDYEGCPK